jgi:Spy/CpxP family protein refolding chaperone
MRVKVFAALAALALGGSALLAQEPRQARRVDRAALQADLGLSDEQMTQIRKIRLEERKAAIRRNADMRLARLELEELMSAATLDEAAIAARVKALGELQAATFKARSESRLAVRRLVTAEQYQKMQQLKRGAVRAHRARPMRRPMRHEGGAAGPGPGDGEGDGLAEADPS